MAYRFKQDESVPESIRRIARKWIPPLAVWHMPGSGALDEAVHDGRKRVKKVRALLRLAQSELGDSYGAETRVLRKEGRPNSSRASRRQLGNRDPQSAPEKYRGQFMPVGGRSHSKEVGGAKETLRRTGEYLGCAPGYSDDPHEGWQTCEELANRGRWLSGSRTSDRRDFRKGQVASLADKKRPDPENFHNWRKRVKDHWYMCGCSRIFGRSGCRVTKPVCRTWKRGWATTTIL